MAVREGEECFEEFVDHLSGEESAARHFVPGKKAVDKDNFVDIISGITAVGDAEPEGWILRMRWHVQIYQWRRWQRVLSTHLV